MGTDATLDDAHAQTAEDEEQDKLLPTTTERIEMRTATILRYRIHGTPNHELVVMYRGRPLYRYHPDSIDIAKDHARAQGFTHVHFAGDWDKWAKPRGGKL